MEYALNLVLLFLLSLCSIVGEIRQIIVRCFSLRNGDKAYASVIHL